MSNLQDALREIAAEVEVLLKFQHSLAMSRGPKITVQDSVETIQLQLVAQRLHAIQSILVRAEEGRAAR